MNIRHANASPPGALAETNDSTTVAGKVKPQTDVAWPPTARIPIFPERQYNDDQAARYPQIGVGGSGFGF